MQAFVLFPGIIAPTSTACLVIITYAERYVNTLFDIFLTFFAALKTPQALIYKGFVALARYTDVSASNAHI